MKAVPPNKPREPLTASPSVTWLGKHKVPSRLPVMMSPEWNGYLVALLIFLLLVGGSFFLVIFFNYNDVEHTIKKSDSELIVELTKLAHGNLTANETDICADYDTGAFVVSSDDPATMIVENAAVPPTATEFDLGTLNVFIRNEDTFFTTGDISVVAGGTPMECCVSVPSTSGDTCDCIWHGLEFDLAGCEGAVLYQLNSTYCEADLLTSQQIGVNTITFAQDFINPHATKYPLNISFAQTYINNSLVYFGIHKLPEGPSDIIIAANHSGGQLLYSDVLSCNLVPSDCANIPYASGYDFVLISLMDTVPEPQKATVQAGQRSSNITPITVMTTPFILNSQTTDAMNTNCNVNISTYSPLLPNAYVGALSQSANASDPRSYPMNELMVNILQCGLLGDELYSVIQPGGTDVPASYYFSDKVSYVTSPFFPLAPGSTYKVEYSCTVTNIVVQEDDDEVDVSPNVNYDFGHYTWCGHMYALLADDDNCEVLSSPTQFNQFVEGTPDNNNVYIQNCCDFTTSENCIGVTTGPIVFGGATFIAGRSLLNQNSNNPRGGSEIHKFGANQISTVAMQFFVMCMGVDPTSQGYTSSETPVASEMFVSLERINPMIWDTSGRGMTFQAEGHSYWSIDDSILAAFPTYYGQCGVFSAATPWLFNTDQQSVNPSIQMKNVSGYEYMPYPDQILGELPSINHMCSVQGAAVSNCNIRVRSFLPGNPDVVSSSSSKKRDAKVYEPTTGKVFWQGDLKDMPEADIWKTNIIDEATKKRIKTRIKLQSDELLMKAQQKEYERKHDRLAQMHQANVDAVIAKRKKKARGIKT